MIIRELSMVNSSEARVNTATVCWEDRDYPAQELIFEVYDGTLERPHEPCADAFLAACYPLAAVHGETRVRIESQPCPMLVEGLYTAHSWWTSWGGMPPQKPLIELPHRKNNSTPTGPRRSTAFLSGGVDSLHMLMRNRLVYSRDDPAYVREALFIHGFDIGKRARNSESRRFQMMLRRLDPVAADLGLRLVPCRTNLRHFPSKPDFWEYRHNGAALAAVGHAATLGPAFLFIGSSHDTNNPVPWGSHPTVDPLFSSQRMTIVHDGARFSRLDKVRDLAGWPTALAALRVCCANVGDEANCGRCEKCLRTRLELLAVGVESTIAFGPSLPPVDLWEEIVPKPIGGRAMVYEDLLEPLRKRGFGDLCRVLEKRIAAFPARLGEGAKWSSI